MTKRKLWHALAGLSLVAATLLLTACGSAAGAQKASGTDKVALVKKVKPTTITFWHAMAGKNGAAIEQVAKDFNATVGKEQGITVKTVFQDVQIASKVKMVSRTHDAKNAPDVIQTVGMDIPTISKLPQVVPVSQVLKQNAQAGVVTNDYYPQLLRAFTYQKQLIGLPMSASTLLFYYNRDLLQQAGVSKVPTTIAEMAAAAQAVGQHTKATGLNSQIGRYQLTNFIVSQSQTSYFGNHQGGRQAPMTATTIKDDGTLRAFLDQWTKVVQSGSYKSVEDNANEEFATGANAMTLLSSSRLGAIKGLVAGKFNYGVADLPQVNAQDSSTAAAGGASLVLYNRGDNNKLTAAWKFMKYATAAETQAKWAQATGYIPVNRGSEKLPAMQQFYRENPEFKVALEQLKKSKVQAQEPFDLVNLENNKIITAAMQKFAHGELSEDATIDQIVTKINAALNEYHRTNG